MFKAVSFDGFSVQLYHESSYKSPTAFLHGFKIVLQLGRPIIKALRPYCQLPLLVLGLRVLRVLRILRIRVLRFRVLRFRVLRLRVLGLLGLLGL